jgi:hypothetical protein
MSSDEAALDEKRGLGPTGTCLAQRKGDLLVFVLVEVLRLTYFTQGENQYRTTKDGS